MLPTPSTSHVNYDRVYEPAEDSFLFLDTLSSPTETAFLTSRFFSSSRFGFGDGDGGASDRAANVGPPSPPSSPSPSSRQQLTPTPAPTPPPPPPLVVEIGTGSGVVIAFVTAQARHIFGSADVLTAGVDVNSFACEATAETVRLAVSEEEKKKHTFPPSGGGTAAATPATPATPPLGCGMYLGSTAADLTSALRPGEVDVLLFNPPYVPTPEMPGHSSSNNGGDNDDLLFAAGEGQQGGVRGGGSEGESKSSIEREAREREFARDSYLLELSYAGGRDGMETTSRLIASLPRVLSRRGCAYVLLCAQNRPEEVIRKEILPLGPEWRCVVAGRSGKVAGWEKLQILRIWRREEGEEGEVGEEGSAS